MLFCLLNLIKEPVDVELAFLKNVQNLLPLGQLGHLFCNVEWVDVKV